MPQQYNPYVQSQLRGYSPSQMPQSVLGQAAGTLSGGLKGELPQDVQDLIQTQAAQYGVATGMPGAQISGYRGLRQLGLTSLDRIREAEGRVTPFFQTPYQTSQQQLQAAGFPTNKIEMAGPWGDQMGSASSPWMPQVGMPGGGAQQPAQRYPSLASLPQSPYGGSSAPLRTPSSSNIDWGTNRTSYGTLPPASDPLGTASRTQGYSAPSQTYGYDSETGGNYGAFLDPYAIWNQTEPQNTSYYDPWTDYGDVQQPPQAPYYVADPAYPYYAQGSGEGLNYAGSAGTPYYVSNQPDQLAPTDLFDPLNLGYSAYEDPYDYAY